MRVLKFGGTSMADASSIKAVSKIILPQFEKLGGLVVVVSAFGGITDVLVSSLNKAESGEDSYLASAQELFDRADKISRDLLDEKSLNDCLINIRELELELSNILYGVAMIKEASVKTRDLVLSFGERISAFVLSAYINQLGFNSEYIDARKYVVTDDGYGSARVNFKVTNELIQNKLLNTKAVAVVTGFIGSDLESGRTTTLGRGGSDYSAAIFASALASDELQIWTDVSGVLSADPRKVKKAYTIDVLSYKEALELSHFGAKVLYAPTVHPARENNIPVRIKNTFRPQDEGTLILAEKTDKLKNIAGVTAISGVSLINIEGAGMQGVSGTASRLFKSLALSEVNVIMITQASSEHSITIAVMGSQSEKAKAAISKEFEFEINRGLIDPIETIEQLSLIAMIGENMRNQPGISGKLFNALGKNGINVEAIAQGSSELNISFAVRQKDEVKALNCIHDSFFLSESKSLNLYVVGTGLVGSRLLSMIHENKEELKKSHNINILLKGLSNSRKMIFAEEELSTQDSDNQLVNSNNSADLGVFVDNMIKANLPNSVFVDNTAGKTVPSFYDKILKHSISISTPNKVALSSDVNSYLKLKSTAVKNNCSINYETNVGAGLPVISTLQNMVNSGDNVFKIIAVLSGSLSYIFNSFNEDSRFSDIVKKARSLGYTEPDPRDDLSGLDAMRKLLILARESGYLIESNKIVVNPCLTEKCMSAENTDAFFRALENEDALMSEKLHAALSKNKRLRFIARFENGTGSIGLEEVGQESPFYNLSGSDNMIAYYSERYKEAPLIVRGPGAGADVTAAGVLAEIINLGKQ